MGFPNNLSGLHQQEQLLRDKAMSVIQSDPKCLLHLDVIERAMSLSKIVVDYPAEDENFKVIKMLSIRMFNSFGASLKLMLSGYHQKGGLVMRDTLETIFLMDLFRTDNTMIESWRFADERKRRNMFSPAAVRKALDERDGLNTKRRAEIYKMFSELAAHPNMHSQHMLRPEKDGDIIMGPFMEATSLQAGLAELGRLAVQAGAIMRGFLPSDWDPGFVCRSFTKLSNKWIETFYRQPSENSNQ